MISAILCQNPWIGIGKGCLASLSCKSGYLLIFLGGWGQVIST